jgi:hypothetical protein
MNETLTSSEGQKVVQDLKVAINNINTEIKNSGVLNTSVQFLESKKDLLQNKLNELLKKGGVINEEDYNDSYTIIRAKEEKELTDLYKRGNRRVIMVIGGAVLLAIGIYIITKRK